MNALWHSTTRFVACPNRISCRFVLAAVILVGVASGCGGYRLGPTNGLSARSQSVFVQPFTNETLQPRFEDDFTHAVRIGVQREGTYRLGTQRDADILIQGAITHYTREGLSFNPDDLVQVEDYNLIVTARVSAYERASGRKIFERTFNGSTQVRAESDLTSAERQALPLVAEDMGYRIVDQLADGDW